MTRLRIGLLWHSPSSGNLGVGALTVGNMRIVAEVAAGLGIEPQFTIYSFHDYGPRYDDEARVFWLDGRSLIDPRRFAADIGGMDIVLDIGAGDSFTDIYPLRRYAWVLIVKVIALMKRRSLIFSPQTIGPFEGGGIAKRWLNKLAGWTMTRAAAVVVRDRISAATVRAVAPRVEPVYSVDVAFALPWTAPAAANDGVRVGLNVSGLLWNGGHTGRGEFGLDYDYQALTTQVIEALLARGDVRVELICHVTDRNPTEDDGSVADAIAARWPALVRVPNFASPSAAKSHIAGLDLLIGARMHACIAAFSSGVPVLPISYSRKFEGLFGSLGYTRMVPCTGMATAAAVAYITGMLDDREAMKREIAAGLTQVEVRLDAYRAVLRTALAAARGDA